MKYLNRKDKKNRKNFCNLEKKTNVLKALVRTHSKLPLETRRLYQISYCSFTKNYFTELVNRCKFTYSARSIHRVYHLSRAMFRSCASFSYFFGLKKASW